jgi:hypothetical protein
VNPAVAKRGVKAGREEKGEKKEERGRRRVFD